MALPFENDVTISSNPFLDILMRNLKILTYNCIIKDEYEANRKETEQSFKMAELYISCIENDISLAMFSQAGIGIPDSILYSVFDRNKPAEADILKLYKNFGNSIEWIPKDVSTTNDSVSSNSRYLQINYRHQLLSKLKSWYLQTYEEQNEYYRMICGLPSLKSWGIPVRDYEQYLPSYIIDEYHGDFIHELDVNIINELNTLGVLDIIRMEYPNEKYLIYLPATLDLYEVRKKSDMHILWLPSDVVNEDIKREFESKYNERREFMIKTVYSSALEIESEYYHSLMIIYLLVMTMLDMMAELQQHIIKKDIMDRRCVEYLFSQQGITYYKNIPYKYQEKLCANLHNLIKYKACTKNIMTIKSLFGFDDSDLDIYRYYLMKVRKYNINGDFIIEGEKTLISEPNSVIEKYVVDDEISNYTELVNMTFFNKISDDETEEITKEYFKREIPYPYDNYENKKCYIIVKINDILLKNTGEDKDKEYLLEFDEKRKYNAYIKIKKDIIENADNAITYEFYVDEILNTTLETNNFSYQNLKLNTVYVHNYSNSHKISLIDVFPFSYNYLYLPDKLWVVVGNYWLSKNIETDTIELKYIKQIDTTLNKKFEFNIIQNNDIFNTQVQIEIIQDKISNNYYLIQLNNDNNEILNLIEINKDFDTVDTYNILNYSKTDNFIVHDDDNNYWIIPNNIKKKNSIKTYTMITIITDEEYELKEDDGTDSLKVTKIKNNEYKIERVIMEEDEIVDTQQFTCTRIVLNEELSELADETILLFSNYWFIKNTSKSIEKFKVENNGENNYLITRDNNNIKELHLDVTLNDNDKSYLIKKYTKEFEIILDQSTSRQHILKIDDDININNKDIYIVYFEDNNIDIRFTKIDIDINTDNKNIYDIKEPFPYYIDNNNELYVSLTIITVENDGSLSKNSEFIQPSEYEISIKTSSEDNDENEFPIYQLEFTNTEFYDKLISKPSNLLPGTVYHKIGLNYVYTNDSIINDFTLYTKEIKFSPTYNRQIEFPIKQLLNNNKINNIYNIYMKYNEKWFNPNTDFSYTNTNIIVDDSIVINDINSSSEINQDITLLIVYSDKDRTDLKYNNISISKQFFVVESLTSDFKYTLKYPITNYIKYKYNKIIIDVMGEYLYDGDYEIKNGILTIYNKTKLFLNAIINVTYIYNKIGKYTIYPNLNLLSIGKDYIVNAINNKSTIEIENELQPVGNFVHFNPTDNYINFNYIYKGNDIKTEWKPIKSISSSKILIGNKLINNSDVTFEQNYDSITDNISEQIIYIPNLQYISLQNYISDILNISLIHFYIIEKNPAILTEDEKEENVFKRSISLNKTRLTLESSTIEQLIEEKNKDFNLPLDYFDNQWPYFITYKYDEHEKYLSDDCYDIIDGKFYLNYINIEDSQLDEINSVSELIFNFVYTIKPNYLYYKYLEEYDKNIELEFCRVPISEEMNLTEYLSNRANWKDYDSIVSIDNWWVGNKYKNNYANLLKKQIYQQKFNVIRTKYYSLNQEEDFNKYTVQTSLFYSMLFDNNFGFKLNRIEQIIENPDYNENLPEDQQLKGPNGKAYEQIDIDELISQGYTKDEAIEELAKYDKYTQELAPNGIPYDKDDIQELINKGYTKEDAILELSKREKYTKNLNKIIISEKDINESDMKLTIQPISYYHSFKVSHLFLYMICLSYIYNNQDLPKIEHLNENVSKYAIGFNFTTSKEKIKKVLRDVYLQDFTSDLDKISESEKAIRELLDDIDFGDNLTQQTDIIHRFMEIYTANKKAYNTICKHLLSTEDIAEFNVWNYLYYELMTWKYNTSYFKLTNGTKLADTYEEFLKDQDGVLYNSIESIKNIYDIDTKIDLITSFLDNIEQALDEYLMGSKDNTEIREKNKENMFLIKAYTGKFTNIIISYMKQILDFFKSYKIYIRDLDTIISFDSGEENEENTYKIYEEIIFNYTLNYLDYTSFDEEIVITEYKLPVDREIDYIDPFKEEDKQYIVNKDIIRI